ncbi:MAG: DNA replication/repair protein RecF [Caulobacteraceae bacterium]
MRSRIHRLQLTDFRSYGEARLEAEGRTVFLFGPNGAGKTNLLEAISLLSPGRGLRGAALADIGRREIGEGRGRPWAVAAVVVGNHGELGIGAGFDPAQSARREARVDGESVAPSVLAEHLRPLWLTPAQDRLFLDAASDRRRFFDRLVYAGRPEHAASVAAYERGLRERGRLLAEASGDVAWLAALEHGMAIAGARIAIARASTLNELAIEIDARAGSAFPRANLALTGEWETAALSGMGENDIADRLADALARGRPRDAAAGRALTGPHRGDLVVVHGESGRAAADCSTGEQKAMVLGLILAQAARLSRGSDAPNPVVLLDEVAAHLDAARRAALFDEIEALSLQAFLTGTDASLFETLKGRAIGAHVRASVLGIME